MEAYTEEYINEKIGEILDFVVGCNMDNNGEKFAKIINN